MTQHFLTSLIFLTSVLLALDWIFYDFKIIKATHRKILRFGKNEFYVLTGDDVTIFAVFKHPPSHKEILSVLPGIPSFETLYETNPNDFQENSTIIWVKHYLTEDNLPKQIWLYRVKG